MPNHSNTLPTRVTRDGKEWWSIDNRLLPVISGGSDGGSASPPATGDNGGNDNAGNDDKPLGPEGEKALDAWKTRARAAELKSKEASAAAKERDELRAQLDKLQEQSKSDHEKALDKAVKEAEERVRKELEGSVNARLITAELRAAAGGKLTDPEDAVRFIDAGDFKVNADGEVDAKAIRDAVDQLVKEKPYLAGKAKPSGNVDQGARDNGNAPKVSPGLGRLTAAFESRASQT